ncbi:DUF1223 domain-containing protein [Ramlibacter albus]|uniref:DUF1223 domain-containing protein n=1 Tax=Ramlibacter albus TaxID=2079448 RepID=A0A923M802_9BURK|nr:DUF1223 domain-containing protein [Ramlibacter albus]MBC5764399.1 DUF1223 domain-containing protein [Ramlibacter albus]
MPSSPLCAAALASLACAGGALAAPNTCEAVSGAQVTPVLELYTSEGCSSCPPADRWLSQLKTAAAQGRVVAQAFHVGYWDYIGWVDRFAAPSHTARQREVAAKNGQRGIYTPQLVRNGQDWRDYSSALAGRGEPSQVAIRLARTDGDAFEASVTPSNAQANWAAYWTVTEHGHSSKVKAGENAGEYLQHDFVVRQYVPVGQYQGVQQLKLRAVAAEGQRARQVNLVVFEPKSGKPLQALSLGCS